MKTTVDIQDSLLEEARRLAAIRSTSLRSLIEEGLRLIINHESVSKQYRLPDRSFGGDGLSEDFAEAAWPEFRRVIYGEST